VTELSHKHVEIRREEGFRHTVHVRGHRFPVDEPVELGGGDTAASPLELLAASLGACTASTIEMYADRKGWDVGGVEVDVDFSPPRSGTRARFELTLRVPAALDSAQVERLEWIARKCPVRRTLEGAEFVERVERAG
jgi:putative redox protein